MNYANLNFNFRFARVENKIKIMLDTVFDL